MNAIHLDPSVSVIFWGTLLLLLGIVGRFFAIKLKQPGVLGELILGMILGNLGYFYGMPLMQILRDGTSVVHATEHTQWMSIAQTIDVFSRYGVLFLLFMVGLDSSLNELKKTGQASLRVALLGVFAPIILGAIFLGLTMKTLSFHTLLFVVASLSATSIGITARVLKDMRKLETREAKTILGAAVLDDILGLIILAMVTSMVTVGAVDHYLMAKTTFFALLFFAASLFLGPKLLRLMIKWLSFLPAWEAKLLTAFLFLMLMSWLAAVAQLATIVGAFLAGLILHDGFFESHAEERTLKQLIAPLESIFAPLFFVFMGMQVRLELFSDHRLLFLSCALSFVAIVGKLVSGFGAARGDDRLAIGLGMLPRGEVGLIFASMGRGLGVLDDVFFASIVMMVIVTTFLTPIGFKKHYSRKK